MEQLKLEQFLQYTSLSNLKKSLTGKHLSYVSAKMRLKENDYVHTLHMVDEGKHSKILNLKNSGKYYWESDESILYFDEKTEYEKELKKNRHTVVYRYNIETHTSTHAHTFPFPVSNITVIDKDNLLLYSSLNEAEHAYFKSEIERDEFIAQDEYNQEFEEIIAIPFQSDGGSFTRNRNSQVFHYHNEKYIPLGSKDEKIGSITLNEAKTKVYYTYAVNNKLPSFYADLRVYDLATKTYTNITEDQKYSYSRLIVLDDVLYFIGSDKKAFGMNQNGDFYKVVKNQAVKVADFGLSANNSVGSDVRYGALNTSVVYDNKYYFVGSNHYHTVIYEFDGESVKEFKRSENSLDSIIFFEDKLYSIEISDTVLQELYCEDTQLTTYNEKILKDVYIAKPHHIEFENDGVKLDGWVLLPQNYDESKSYPSILDIHGGPKTIYSTVFYHEMQVWANLGYIVYFANPRGGDCYGNEFMDIRGKYGTIDYEDLMKFTDIVEERFALDKERMGVTGGSYGGFMTNWIVSHTNRFSAAATQRSISNWISFAGNSDIGSYFAKDQTAADTLKDVELAWNQSPLKYADNIQTPLLFIHSDADHRCPMEQAMQLFSRVKLNGIETRLVYFKNECHDLSRSGRPKARVKRLTEITEWMNSHLK